MSLALSFTLGERVAVWLDGHVYLGAIARIRDDIVGGAADVQLDPSPQHLSPQHYSDFRVCILAKHESAYWARGDEDAAAQLLLVRSAPE